MALIVPNATATGSSNKYSSINQAEPDSVDFEALGNTLNYIRSGFVVTIGASNAISVTAGVAVINGVPYNAASAFFTGATALATRFDVIVARLSGASVTTTLVSGTADDTNPTLPQSKSTLASGSGTSFNYDPATDSLIATIYTIPSTALSSSSVVDKRIINTAPITYVVSSVPSSGVDSKDVIGDTVVVAGNSYIKNTSSTWARLSVSTEVDAAKIPIGGLFAFAGSATTAASPNSAYYLECNGQPLSTTGTYANLFAAIGYTFGGSGATFNLPNLVADTGLVGASSTEITNNGKTAASANTASVVLPEHRHSYTTTIGSRTGTTNNGDRATTFNSGQSISGSVTGSSHTHYPYGGGPGTTKYFAIRRSDAINTPHYEAAYVAGAYGGTGMILTSGDYPTDFTTGSTESGGSVTSALPTSIGMTTTLGNISVTTDIGNPTGNTDYFGTPSASMSILSKSIRVRWFIRHA